MVCTMLSSYCLPCLYISFNLVVGCSVMYILCNEEPLWMSLCLGIVNRQLEYRGSWKKTALDQYVSLASFSKTLSLKNLVIRYRYLLNLTFSSNFMFDGDCRLDLLHKYTEASRRTLQFDGI